LDPGRKRDFAFISHAHADHTGKHDTIIASPATARFIKHRLDVDVDHVLDYGTRTLLNDGYLTLHPSGHILGAAQALVEFHGERLVYTGDFKLKSSRTAEACKILECDHLVMECTYGRPHYRFPDREEVEAQFLEYVRKVLEDEGVPIILAYALGRAQEILKLLLKSGFKVAVENRIYEMSKIYEELGVTFGKYERYDPEHYAGRVLMFPPHLWNSPVVRSIRGRHSIAVTGWAMDGRQTEWYRSKAAFPISDHADFDDLLRYIELAKPKVVSLIHGFKEFADHIQQMGVKTQIVAGLIS
jgi:DNA ligase-1